MSGTSGAILIYNKMGSMFCVIEESIMFKHLLVPLDGSSLAECALPHTIAFARAFKPQVTLLRVLAAPAPGTAVDLFDWQLQKAEAEAYLDGIAARLQTAGVPVETVVAEGQPANCVINTIPHHQIDLVVLSSHGESGLVDWSMGSVAQKILLRSHVSSLLVRPYQPFQARQTDLRYQRLLVPLDGSRRAECVLPFATTLAHCYGAQLVLAHVFRHPEMPGPLPLAPEDQLLAAQMMARNREAVTKYLEQLKAQLPNVTEMRLLTCEDVAAGLHELAVSEQVDLVILSAHGYTCGNQWSYGSVITNIIVYGTTPLLLVQDLAAGEWASTPAEVTLGEQGNHLYMASERFQSAESYG
jgi:nucleotide-binding universal stress UspA family protein